MNDKQSDPGIEKPEDIIDDIDETLDDLHAKLVEDTTQIGQARDRYKAIRPYWADLGNASTTDHLAAEVYASGVHALSSIRDDIKFIAGQYAPIGSLMGTVSASAVFAVRATSSTASIVSSGTLVPESDWLQPIEAERRNRTRDGLRKLDPSLAETYDGIWEVLYGTRSDPERGSLYMIRQVFDHFFGILAPDDNVRESKYRHPKKGPKPNEVAREEKLEYAAQTHIKNESMAKRLVDSTKHVLVVYKALNRAHKRGALDQTKARTALKEMQSIIENWVEALDY